MHGTGLVFLLLSFLLVLSCIRPSLRPRPVGRQSVAVASSQPGRRPARPPGDSGPQFEFIARSCCCHALEVGDIQRTNELNTIGQTAAEVGVATSTLRYYERQGLLSPAGRSRAGYRLYNANAVTQLRFIRSAQSVGFSLENIKALLALDERTSCRQVQVMIEERLAEIARRIAELKSVQGTLHSALNRCHKSRKGCPILSDLRQTDRRSKR